MKVSKDKIRRPAVAGQFYSGDPEVLKREVVKLLEHADDADVKGQITALICPHAGYPYSGRIAASAYKQIQGQDIDTVVVTAPSHRDVFQGASIYNGGAYQTPLGTIPVDVELACAMAQQDPDIFRLGDDGHKDEHSLEVQLPFLQETLKNFRIVPIVLCELSLDLVKRLADAVASAIKGRKLLIVASSDLYHGYSYKECLRSDSKTLSKIEEFDPEGFFEGIQKEDYQACGAGPITTALLTSRKIGADKAQIIARTNSNDVTGQRFGYVVGYGASVIYKSDL